jgi:hypothetical protein
MSQVQGDILPTFVSPQMAKNKLNEVNAYADAIQSQSAPQSGKSLALYSSFMQDFATWKRFYADNIDVFWSAKGVLEQTEAWQVKLQEWRKTLEKAGLHIETVEPAPPEKFITPGQGMGLGLMVAAAAILYLATRDK